MNKAYPRREDTVYWERFDGTALSAQKIAQMTKATVILTIAPDPYMHAGDTLQACEIDTVTAKAGDYVIVKDYNPTELEYTWEVLSPIDFHDKYSKDGN